MIGDDRFDSTSSGRAGGILPPASPSSSFTEHLRQFAPELLPGGDEAEAVEELKLLLKLELNWLRLLMPVPRYQDRLLAVCAATASPTAAVNFFVQASSTSRATA